MTAEASNTYASSTGQQFTAAGWLDVHFEANRIEYEAQVRAAGIQPGWHVLDAGCGGGNFLPWLADVVGSAGRLTAFDLAPDNIATVESRLTTYALSAPVETRVGSVLALPYADDIFDAVWCANTTQYLSDNELRTALAEFRRVVRPGGLVAIKENDPTLNRILPAPPGTLLHHFEARARNDSRSLRAPALPVFLRDAGLTAVARRTILIERAPPLNDAVRHLYRDFLIYCASQAASLELPAAEQEYWARLQDAATVERLLDDPDFYTSQGNILAVGTVPGGKAESANPEPRTTR